MGFRALVLSRVCPMTGTFGLGLWNRLQEAAVTDKLEQAESLEKKPDFTGAALKHSFLELE